MTNREPAQGMVLEIASGTGEHAVYFAPRLPHLTWQPTDVNEQSFRSIAAWSAALPADNLLPPLLLDAQADEWSVREAQAVVNRQPLDDAHCSTRGRELPR